MWLILTLAGTVCLMILILSLKSSYIGPIYTQNHHRRILLIIGGLAWILAFLFKENLLSIILLSIGIFEFGLGAVISIQVAAENYEYNQRTKNNQGPR